MLSTRNNLYTLLAISCVAGYIWLFYCTKTELVEKDPVEVCLFKHFTSIPCPSCGSTRSVRSIIKVDFLEALQINPLGFIIAIILVITPLWIFFDVIAFKNSLFEFSRKLEEYLKKPPIAIPLIIIILINWIWNIAKGI